MSGHQRVGIGWPAPAWRGRNDALSQFKLYSNSVTKN